MRRNQPKLGRWQQSGRPILPRRGSDSLHCSLIPHFRLSSGAILGVIWGMSINMAAASEQPVELGFSRIYVFGDSLSDTGNRAHLKALTRWGYRLVRWYLRVFCPKRMNAYQGGRQSNGPVAVEEIAEQFSTPVEPAWREAEGTNFAVSGALASGSNEVPPLTRQIAEFFERNPGDGELPGDALYIVYIGGNDILRAANTRIADAEKLVDAAVKEIDRCVRQLADRGAQMFLVPNRGDVGNTPHFRKSWARPHQGRRATRLSLHFNCRLAPVLDRLETELGIAIVRFDSFDFGRRLRADASAYGWTNLSASCLSASCDAGFDEYFFFDKFHPTAKRHKLNGEALCDTIRATLGRKIRAEELA